MKKLFAIILSALLLMGSVSSVSAASYAPGTTIGEVAAESSTGQYVGVSDATSVPAYEIAHKVNVSAYPRATKAMKFSSVQIYDTATTRKTLNTFMTMDSTGTLSCITVDGTTNTGVSLDLGKWYTVKYYVDTEENIIDYYLYDESGVEIYHNPSISFGYEFHHMYRIYFECAGNDGQYSFKEATIKQCTKLEPSVTFEPSAGEVPAVNGAKVEAPYVGAGNHVALYVNGVKTVLGTNSGVYDVTIPAGYSEMYATIESADGTVVDSSAVYDFNGVAFADVTATTVDFNGENPEDSTNMEYITEEDGTGSYLALTRAYSDSSVSTGIGGNASTSRRNIAAGIEFSADMRLSHLDTLDGNIIAFFFTKDANTSHTTKQVISFKYGQVKSPNGTLIGTVDANEWFNIKVIFDTTSQKAYYYIDGELCLVETAYAGGDIVGTSGFQIGSTRPIATADALTVSVDNLVYNMYETVTKTVADNAVVNAEIKNNTLHIGIVKDELPADFEGDVSVIVVKDNNMSTISIDSFAFAGAGDIYKHYAIDVSDASRVKALIWKLATAMPLSNAVELSK